LRSIMPLACGPALRVVCGLAVLLSTAGCTSARDYREATCRGGQESVTFAFEVDAGSACPEITSYLVEPAEVFLGGAVTVSASVVGLPGAGAYVYWAAPTGSFEDPYAPSTVFSCAKAGKVDVTLDVSSGGCSVTLTSSIECDEPDAS
jgi:hypothetical protein